MVSILTRPEGRVLRGAVDRCRAAGVFQSSPGPKAGCYNLPGGRGKRIPGVSILTRPEGRVLPEQAPGTIPPCLRFNPHPARRPGATPFVPPVIPPATPFQSSPGPKAGCYEEVGDVPCYFARVSILTRPEGRVLRDLADPARRLPQCFNPHPARRPGATRHRMRRLRGLLQVSILTRPEGRVLPPLRAASRSKRECFNPHPARRPGATYPADMPCRVIPGEFQSSPGPKAGCYTLFAGYDPGLFMFQSSPGPKAGCYVKGYAKALRARCLFQSSPGPKAGCYTSAT